MKVTPSIRLRALLSIYRVQRKRRHCSLSQRSLEQEWRLTGLRRSDLHQALEAAVHNLILEKTPGGDFQLTYVGEIAIQASLRKAPFQLREWMILCRARLRLREPRDHRAYGRRHNDPPASAQ